MGHAVNINKKSRQCRNSILKRREKQNDAALEIRRGFKVNVVPGPPCIRAD